MLEIVLQGAQLGLLPERALWWPREKTLIAADLHWGKSGHFRKHGIAIPSATQTQDELRLARLVQQYQAKRLIIAGDFFHSRHNLEVEKFRHWRQAHAGLHIDLVEGNHDILQKDWYADLDIQLHAPSLSLPPFLVVHDNADGAGSFVIHGHVHPGVKLYGQGRQSLSLSCFCVDEHRMILPAFGQFTGRCYLDPAEHKNLYAIADSQVIQLK